MVFVFFPVHWMNEKVSSKIVYITCAQQKQKWTENLIDMGHQISSMMMNFKCDKQMMRYHINIQSKYGELLLNSFNNVLWIWIYAQKSISTWSQAGAKVILCAWQKQNETTPISKLIKGFLGWYIHIHIHITICGWIKEWVRGKKCHLCSFKLNIFLFIVVYSVYGSAVRLLFFFAYVLKLPTEIFIEKNILKKSKLFSFNAFVEMAFVQKNLITFFHICVIYSCPHILWNALYSPEYCNWHFFPILINDKLIYCWLFLITHSFIER